MTPINPSINVVLFDFVVVVVHCQFGTFSSNHSMDIYIFFLLKGNTVDLVQIRSGK